MAFIEILRLRIDPADVERVLALRVRHPELRQVDLVRVGEDVWLEIRTWWTEPATAADPPAWTELVTVLGRDRGERVHTTGTAWAAGR